MKTLFTERLILKTYIESNLNDLHRLLSSKDVWRYSTRTYNTSIEAAKTQLDIYMSNYKNNRDAPLALYLKNGNYIGEAGIYSSNKEINKINIGYNILPEFWSNGFATEITKEILKYNFQSTKINRIEATTVDSNKASARVLEKCNMKYEGTLRDVAIINNVYVNVSYYSMIKKEFE